MAEWLRRLTRNQLGSSRAGSNPARVASNFDFHPFQSFSPVFVYLVRSVTDPVWNVFNSVDIFAIF